MKCLWMLTLLCLSQLVFANVDDLLIPRYAIGEAIAYRMTGQSESPGRIIRYEAQGAGEVRKSSTGVFIEELRWSGFTVNGEPIQLPGEARASTQILSLDPAFQLPRPEELQIHPMLIGPALDLQTFYYDYRLASRFGNLKQVGDRIFHRDGVPNSWARLSGMLIAEDAVDFEITLKDLDREKDEAVLLIHHLPPAESTIQLPAKWMREPVVAGFANNWVQVAENEDHTYTAQVGKETFDVELWVELSSGRIKSAAMDNPVEIQERRCKDRDLANCGESARYRIRRQISVRATQ